MNWVALVVALAVPQVAGLIGSFFTFKNIPTWYRGLRKPRLSPPNWVFGPVWTTLYVLMGIASYLVWMQQGWGIAIELYALQLVLNTIWSIIFFGMRSPGVAFFELICMWLAILATIIAFWPISVWAGILMLPYIAWVSFAGFLNLRIWQLNT